MNDLHVEFTADQILEIAQILKDMGAYKLADRLLYLWCG